MKWGLLCLADQEGLWETEGMDFIYIQSANMKPGEGGSLRSTGSCLRGTINGFPPLTWVAVGTLMPSCDDREKRDCGFHSFVLVCLVS